MSLSTTAVEGILWMKHSNDQC